MDINQQRQLFGENRSDRDKAPDDARIVGALSDLNNALANVQRELEQRNAELERAIREKNQVLGMAAHDLRNPLGVIVGMVDILGEDLASTLSEENRNLLAAVAGSAEYMVRLIDGMLPVPGEPKTS